jgi:hypothetical protein
MVRKTITGIRFRQKTVLLEQAAVVFQFLSLFQCDVLSSGEESSRLPGY